VFSYEKPEHIIAFVLFISLPLLLISRTTIWLWLLLSLMFLTANFVSTFYFKYKKNPPKVLAKPNEMQRLSSVIRNLQCEIRIKHKLPKNYTVTFLKRESGLVRIMAVAEGEDLTVTLGKGVDRVVSQTLFSL
jgi:hypothetical protein